MENGLGPIWKMGLAARMSWALVKKNNRFENGLIFDNEMGSQLGLSPQYNAHYMGLDGLLNQYGESNLHKWMPYRILIIVISQSDKIL
jgi:hypothetical protein